MCSTSGLKLTSGPNPRSPERDRGLEGPDGQPPPLVPGVDERQGRPGPRNQHIPKLVGGRGAKVGPQRTLNTISHSIPVPYQTNSVSA